MFKNLEEKFRVKVHTNNSKNSYLYLKILQHLSFIPFPKWHSRETFTHKWRVVIFHKINVFAAKL